MHLVKRMFAVAGILLLAACSGASSNATVDALNKAQASGSPFTKNLAMEYRAYANNEQEKMLDYADALHFARKGLAAASGITVMPETLDDWDLSDANLIEMTADRIALVDALEAGGREIAPDKAAVAQARFDCWAEQQEERWNADVPCKGQFKNALRELQALVGERQPAAPAPETFMPPVAAVPDTGTVPIEQAMFIVFFDWDRFDITSGANDVLDAVAQEVNARKDIRGIVLVGHTDTSGPTTYNDKLSVRRANSVRDALIARGVPAGLIRTEARGENDLLVKTADNVREPANRRAQITLE